MSQATSPPQRIAILGAGPVGLEAALAAIDLNLDFRLYEMAPHAAGNIRRWGHVRLFTPWDLNVSERMHRHLTGAGQEVPSGDVCPAGDELADRILDPVARLPRVAPRLSLGTRVLAVGRQRLLKHEQIGSDIRRDQPFRLVVRDQNGIERAETADMVLDCTGTYSVANALGTGGIAAPGETAAEGLILRHIPNPRAEPAAWADRKILLVGAGHSAQTAVCDLAEFATEYPATRVIWALRSESPEWHVDPDDPLPERSRLTAHAAEIAGGASAAVEVASGVVVDALRPADDGLEVDLRSRDGATRSVTVDLIVSLTGYIGDASLHRQLQIHECYATSGPMKLAAALLGGSADCLAQESHGIDTLANPEPRFFVLGIKSYGRSPGFLMQVGWDQVNEVFASLARQGAGLDKAEPD